MTMVPGLRKFVLTAHVISSVGWLGAVVAYLALAVAAMTSQDAQMVRAAWIAMELTGWFVIVPLALASLLIGLVQSLSTPWGLIRHYWVVVKFLLTVFATIILLLHMPTVSYFAGVAAETNSAGLGGLRGELLHAGGGLLVLLVTTTLSVYKPRGMTPYGRRTQHKKINGDSGLGPDWGSTTGTPRWVKVFGIIALVLLLLVVIMRFTSRGRHGPGRHIPSGNVGGQTPPAGVHPDHDTPALSVYKPRGMPPVRMA
jgi:hypothetical protein